METLIGQVSIKALTKGEAALLIDELCRRSEQDRRREGMATKRQLWTIQQYRAQLGWDEKHMRNFIQKTTGVASENWLTLRTASHVISALASTPRWVDEKKTNF